MHMNTVCINTASIHRTATDLRWYECMCIYMSVYSMSAGMNHKPPICNIILYVCYTYTKLACIHNFRN